MSKTVKPDTTMHDLSFMGKILVVFGGLLVLVGLLLWFFDHIPYLGKLPGDIYIQKENFTFYFPLTTCIILSLLLSLIFYLFGKIQ
jgi:uncharacterized protein HemY